HSRTSPLRFGRYSRAAKPDRAAPARYRCHTFGEVAFPDMAVAALEEVSVGGLSSRVHDDRSKDARLQSARSLGVAEGRPCIDRVSRVRARIGGHYRHRVGKYFSAAQRDSTVRAAKRGRNRIAETAS